MNRFFPICLVAATQAAAIRQHPRALLADSPPPLAAAESAVEKVVIEGLKDLISFLLLPITVPMSLASFASIPWLLLYDMLQISKLSING